MPVVPICISKLMLSQALWCMPFNQEADLSVQGQPRIQRIPVLKIKLNPTSQTSRWPLGFLSTQAHVTHFQVLSSILSLLTSFYTLSSLQVTGFPLPGHMATHSYSHAIVTVFSIPRYSLLLPWPCKSVC